MTKKKDNIFLKSLDKQFEFDSSVASVFDDMLERSIPFYKENLSLIASLIDIFTKENDVVLDLGCSTANTLIKIFQKSTKPLKFIGYDNAKAMLELARKKSKAYGANIHFQEGNILNLDFPKSNIIIANYTLQFIRPLQRQNLVKKIYDSLKENGIFFISEKIIYENKVLHKQMIELYGNFKKSQGYSEFEIAQKREALENILIPYTENENKKMLKDIGFKEVEIVFKWANFATFMAKK